MTYRSATQDEFLDALARSRASGALREQIARYDFQMMPAGAATDYQIHEGPLRGAGRVRVPGLFTLVLGDVAVDGLFDAANPDGYDEGGGLIVVGHVRCRAFAGHYGKITLIDGDLRADEIVLNAYQVSALTVMGDLVTRFFYGRDLWAEVGGRVAMKAGEGYCLPIGWADAPHDAIEPRLGEDASLALLHPPARRLVVEFELDDLRDLVATGAPIVR